MTLAAAALPPIPGGTVLPLLPDQADRFCANAWERQQGLDLPPYNIGRAVTVRGQFDLGAARAAVDELVCRHEALRVAFPDNGRAGWQVVYPPTSDVLELIDLSGHRADERTARATEVLQELAVRRFDCTTGLLFRAHVVRLADDWHVVSLVVEHLTVDGVSAEVLYEEFWELYRVAVEGRPARLAPSAVSYSEYVRREVRWLGGQSRVHPLIDFWRQRLDGMGVVPEFYLHGAEQQRNLTYRGGVVRAEVGPDVAAGVQVIGERAMSSPFGVLLAAFGAVLFRHSGQHDLGHYVPVARRTSLDVERLVGLVSSHTIVRQDVSGDPTFLDLIERTRDAVLEAFEYSDIPFAEIARRLDPTVSGRHREFPGLWCDLTQWAGEKIVEIPNAVLEAYRGTRVESTFELLGLFGTCRSDGISLIIGYPSDIYQQDDAARLLTYLKTFLRIAVASPAELLSALFARTDRAMPEQRVG